MAPSTTPEACRGRRVMIVIPLAIIKIWSPRLARAGRPITVAGLWDEWRDPESGEALKSCTMVITEANGFTRDTHDRMPVILERRAAEMASVAAGQLLTRPRRRSDAHELVELADAA